MFGGSSSAPAEQQQSDTGLASQANNDGYQNNQWGARSCENDAKTFTKCLDEHQGNMQICGWYLEQLVNLFSRSRFDVHDAKIQCRKPANQPPANFERENKSTSMSSLAKVKKSATCCNGGRVILLNAGSVLHMYLSDCKMRMCKHGFSLASFTNIYNHAR